MPLKDYITRPRKLSAIQWNTDNDRRTIEELLSQYNYLHEYHDDEFLAPEHIIFVSLKGQGLILKYQYLIISDEGDLGISNAEKMEKECMTQADYDAMLTELARTLT